jgi:hypothetical protein
LLKNHISRKNTYYKKVPLIFNGIFVFYGKIFKSLIMTIKDSPLAGIANYVYNLKSGDLYFYDSYVISEIFEGVTVVKEDLNEVIDLIHEHYGFKKPYGLISHRFHSYSINLHDILPIVSEFGLLVANAVVGYNEFSFKNFELEKRLLKLDGEIFFDLDDAIKWTNQKVENTRLIN